MNRKELLRQYKARVPPMGVYQVRNTITGNALVAASKDLTSVLNHHRAALKLGGHPSRMLQSDWTAHGADSFVFEVLDTLSPSDDPNYDPTADLAALEDMWLEKLSLKPDRQHTINPRRPK